MKGLARVGAQPGRRGLREGAPLSGRSRDFLPEHAPAIEQEQIQERRVVQKEYELQQAQREAEIAAARAKGKADALRVEGEAQAEYDRKVSQSLTDTLIQRECLKRWDGRLPTHMLGSGAMPMIQLPTE